MTKQEEYNIKFYTKAIDHRDSFFFDTNNAINQYKSLWFINSLDKSEIEDLIEVINRIRNGQIYDPDFFLTNSEVYQVFNVTFSNPTIFVNGYPVIDIDDLATLLREWLYFLEVNSPSAEYIAPKNNLFYFIKKIFK